MMYKSTLLVLCSVVFGSVHAMRDRELFEKIKEHDVEGFKQVLQNKPQLLNEINPLRQTPLRNVICRIISSESSSDVQILKLLLQQEKLQINKMEPEWESLFTDLFDVTDVFYSSSDILVPKYNSLMKVKESLKPLFAHPELDVTVTIFSRRGNSVVDILKSYKNIGIDKYNNLLKLFLDLAPTNEKSWNFMLPHFIAMDDVAVMEQIYTTLKDQQWFKKSPSYSWFDAFNILSQGFLSKDAARAILDTWAGRGRKWSYEQLHDGEKNKANIIMTVYENAKDHKPSLKKLGKYILTRVNALAVVPQDAGSVVVSFLPTVQDFEPLSSRKKRDETISTKSKKVKTEDVMDIE